MQQLQESGCHQEEERGWLQQNRDWASVQDVVTMFLTHVHVYVIHMNVSCRPIFLYL